MEQATKLMPGIKHPETENPNNNWMLTSYNPGCFNPCSIQTRR